MSARRPPKQETPTVPWTPADSPLAELEWLYAERDRNREEAGQLLEQLKKTTHSLQSNWAINNDNEERIAEIRKMLKGGAQ